MKMLDRPVRSMQRGVVVLIMFMILFVSGASLFITFVSNNAIYQEQSAETMQALRDAKEALIGYAVLHGDLFGDAGAGPGHLPCPDTNGDGAENLPCGNNALGRLPASVTATLPNPDVVLQLSDFNYGTDQQIWYALANPARHNPAAAFNTNTSTTVTVDGQANMAAVLIAPGPLIGSQNRPNNNDANYLDGANAIGTAFISSSGAGSENFNDRVLGITVEEIMIPVTARVTEEIMTSLADYHTTNGIYPLAADYVTTLTTAPAAVPAWFTLNNWQTISQYNRLSDDTATITYTGCANISYSLDQTAGSIIRTGTRC